jgi:hypothetical protein
MYLLIYLIVSEECNLLRYLDKIMVHLCTEIQIGDRAASSFVVVTTPSIHFGLHKMCSATSDL